MIVKIKTRKTPSYRQVLEYLLHNKEQLFDEKKQSFIIKHNVKGETIEEWVTQFKENETHRKYKRIKSVLLSHEILSWSKADINNISLAKMEEMAREYIKLRNPRGMYIIVPHTDKEHYHIHICASGVEYHTGKAMRMSKQQFTELKQKIQNFQREKFPELENSIVEHGKKVKALSTDKEYQMKLRTGRASDREQVIGILNKCYHQAYSQEEFFELVKEAGMKIYERGGKVTGVVYGKRKFRFRRIGFSPEILEGLNLSVERGRELKYTQGKRREIRLEK